MNAVRLMGVMMVAGCASAPRASRPAPEALPAADTVRQNIVITGGSQTCATGDAMPNGRPRHTSAAIAQYQMPGTPAPMPNACPVKTRRTTTFVVPGIVPDPRP